MRLSTLSQFYFFFMQFSYRPARPLFFFVCHFFRRRIEKKNTDVFKSLRSWEKFFLSSISSPEKADFSAAFSKNKPLPPSYFVLFFRVNKVLVKVVCGVFTTSHLLVLSFDLIQMLLFLLFIHFYFFIAIHIKIFKFSKIGSRQLYWFERHSRIFWNWKTLS